MADKIYFLPVEPDVVERIIEKDRPDAVFLSFGGQTALNCGVELENAGVFKKYGVQVLGTPVKAIEMTEDRDAFANALKEIDVPVAPSVACNTLEEAKAAANKIGYPLIVRAAYALGGLGSGFADNEAELVEIVQKALALSPQVLVEKSLRGWKEVEYEMVRDCENNCIAVCNMENIDPLGVHTGDSIVVAPSQTLTNDEYHLLRRVAIKVIRMIGIVGECNIQYALDPKSEEFFVIEVNARLSRSSALASKATGYPLAYIAAKLALNKTLVEVKNPVTKKTTACFEPALDYVVIKMPRWDLKKFSRVSKVLGSSMKSVGEVMAIGRNFEEALQKSLRMTETGLNGLLANDLEAEELIECLNQPNEKRILAVTYALKKGKSFEEIFQQTHIDHWFLHKLKNVVDAAKSITTLDGIDAAQMRVLKTLGFSDYQIALLADVQGATKREREMVVREKRKALGVLPIVKQIDTLAAEWPAQTNYLYMTYAASEHDITFNDPKNVVVLGGGAYRIGSSVEFDWCCVSCINALKERGHYAIVINCNPETVSTDYDMSDKLYFEELSHERVLDILDLEQPDGVVVSMGGQTPNNLVMGLHEANVPILGTAPEHIDRAEDRNKFSSLLDELEIDQPAWIAATSLDAAKQFAKDVSYPVLIRPSYVLSGAAMRVVEKEEELEACLRNATNVSTEHPVVVSKFITGAKEIEMDAVAQNGEVKVYAISEHVENAGVHSGDATLVLPAQRLWMETVRRIKKATRAIAKGLRISGPLNIQFIAKDNKIKVIECNLRCSRTFPFVSKVFRINFVEVATKILLGEDVPQFDRSIFELDYVGVKAPQFSFTRLTDADPISGVEMASTGEVACLGDEVHDAFLNALLSTGYTIPKKTVLLSTGPLEKKVLFLESAKTLVAMGYDVYASPGTGAFLQENDVPCTVLEWPLSKKEPNIATYLYEKKIDLVINIPKNAEAEELENDYKIRRLAVDLGIPLVTNVHCAMLFVEALEEYKEKQLPIKSWDEF